MLTFVDIFIHIILSIFSGFFVFKLYHLKGKGGLVFSLLFAFIFGFLIDIDHLLDYILAFGLNFNLNYILNGSEFLENGKNYVIFHGFEYVIILGILFYFIKDKKKKMILGSSILSMLLHLFTDMLLFSVPIQYYFLIYRIINNFKVNP